MSADERDGFSFQRKIFIPMYVERLQFPKGGRDNTLIKHQELNIVFPGELARGFKYWPRKREIGTNVPFVFAQV